jgi:beta-lactamase class A
MQIEGSAATGVGWPVTAELTRRRLLVGAGAAAGLVACGANPKQARPTLSDPAEPLPPLDQRIAALEKRHNARVGLYAADLGSGRAASYNDGQLFAVCSTFKGYAAARVLQMFQAGQVRLDDQVFVDPTALVPNSPRTSPNAGRSMSLAELCAAAVQVSDNTAGNLLLHTIGGPQAITAFARSIGDDATRLDRWETELNSAIPGDPRDTSTPRAIGTGYRNLLEGLESTALGEASRRRLQDWMRANETSSMRAGLPPGWTTADKTGNGDYGSTNDVGIAYGPNGKRLLLSLMTRSAADNPKADNDRPLIGELTTLVVSTLTS